MNGKKMAVTALRNGWQLIRENKGTFMCLGLMMVSSQCFASTTMPWDSGIESLKSNLTGPLPRAGAVISIAAGGTLYALGQSDVSRLAMKGAFGTAIACGAATLAGLFGADSVSGCLFF
ncbi:TrbC/VirB2 family protein [Selenomonas sp. AB3002]|uniref:TrbC/VirB2 family protein n=1 Tax=Selenomonas sp. AB3002 TaxID=1392502 RepID=UPI000495DE80